MTQAPHQVGAGPILCAPRSGGAFLFPQPWHSAPMRALTIALCLLSTPARPDMTASDALAAVNLARRS